MDADGSGWLILEEYSSHPIRTVTVTNAFMTLDDNGDRKGEPSCVSGHPAGSEW